MFRNFNLAVLALFSTVSAKECYEASGKFIMTEGSVSASINVEMDICFPKSSANGQFGTIFLQCPLPPAICLFYWGVCL